MAAASPPLTASEAGVPELEAARPDSETEDIFGFSISEDLVQSPNHELATTAEVDFGGLLQVPLKIYVDLQGGCGGRIWEAGNVLGRYLLRCRREEMRGSGSILELGAGGGLVGLAVAAGCPRPENAPPIHVTDQLPMLSLMQQNIARNGLGDRVQASIYDWGSPRPTELPQYPETILAADCVYFEPAFPLLLATLKEIVGPGTTCYFCFKKRRRADSHLIKTLKRVFEMAPVTDDPDADTYARQNIFVYTIRQKRTAATKI